MKTPEMGPQEEKLLKNILGYLNFASGAEDFQFLASLNQLFAHVEAVDLHDGGSPAWVVVGDCLRTQLKQLETDSASFRDAAQASAVVELMWGKILPAYRQYHSDLLFHQTSDYLFRPFFVGCMAEVVLAQGPPWDEAERVTDRVLTRLNDFVGHRPVATLENRTHQPYSHEWVRPVPLYIQGAGIGTGRYRELIEGALEVLNDTDEDLLRAASFDLERMKELAVDPRACDFDHPVGRRPNYHFGQWDPHHIDSQGFYDRFVLQQVTLDALLMRQEDVGDLPRAEVMSEAAAVLAGTILMASGISGNSPDAHDSTVTLATLLSGIATYRDEFYERLLGRWRGQHAQRLKNEAAERRQPFGGSRQHLNARLARSRAAQMENVNLARIFARMNNPAAAMRQVEAVQAVSSRIRCQIDCCLLDVDHSIDEQRLSVAADKLDESVRLIHRGIACGAIMDPWNILGFDAQYSLFPTIEDSVPDTRADELIDLMEQVFTQYERIWCETAVRDERQLGQRVSDRFLKLAEWWHQFAVHEVSAVDGFHAPEIYTAAKHAASALGRWHDGGAATGDVRFWAPHVQLFNSPKAFTRVISSLLDHGDFVASLSLLVHWLSQAKRTLLVEGESSFHELSARWLKGVQCHVDDADQSWALVQKFFDYVEANADEYWQVPDSQFGNSKIPRQSSDQQQSIAESDQEVDDEDTESFLYSAAYENVVYRDSSDDGVEGDVFGTDGHGNDEWEHESRRIADRLSFLENLARMWKTAAWDCIGTSPGGVLRRDSLRNWFEQCQANRRGLIELLIALNAHQDVAPLADQHTIMEFERGRAMKEALLERIVTTCVETCEAGRFIQAVLLTHLSEMGSDSPGPDGDEMDRVEWHSVRIMADVLSGNAQLVRDHWPEFLGELEGRSLLYIPLARGGDPLAIVQARARQRLIESLLTWLPRFGCLAEACELIDVARQMERNHPVGPPAVTEYDRLFETGFCELVECIVASTQSWSKADVESDALVDCLEQLTQMLLASWLSHSQTLRLSVLEKAADQNRWQSLVLFIQQFGAEIFSQQFLHLANVRAVLHQGIDEWLEQMEAGNDKNGHLRLIDELERGLSRKDVVDHLTLVLETILENYAEYRDYNNTTTQSDRGEMLYMLLDFLRLRTEYDRVAWNLKPVILAYEILIRQSHNEDAELWRRALVERTSDHAQRFVQRLGELQREYSMQMPTVADRLNERFVRPMTIDRVRALVKPALREMTNPEPHTAFDLLEQEAAALAQEPTGAGLDVPAWIVALEEEVNAVRVENVSHNIETSRQDIPHVLLSAEEIKRQLDQWDQRQS